MGWLIAVAPLGLPRTLPQHDNPATISERTAMNGSHLSTGQIFRRVFALGWVYRWWFLLSLGLSALAAGSFGYMVVAVERIMRGFSTVQSAIDDTGSVAEQELAHAHALMGTTIWQLIVLAPIVALTAWAAYLTSQRLANTCVRDLRLRFLGHLVDLDLSFHAGITKGDLLARMMADLSGLRFMIERIYGRILQRPIELLAYVVWVAVLDWRIGSVFAVCLMPIGLVLVRIIGRMKRRSRSARIAMADNLVSFEQITSGIRVIKAMGSSERERQRFSGTNQRLYDRQMAVARTKAVSEAITHGSIFLLLALVLGLGSWLFSAGLTEPATLMAVLLALARATTVLREIQQAIGSIIEHIPSAERVFAVLDRGPALPEDPALPTCPSPTDRIALHAVRFHYGEGQEEVLRGIDLVIPIGSTVALVGPSGGGKSTLLDLVPRLYDVTAGVVAWDGVDVRGYRPSSLIRHCAIVQQDSFLFDDTVFENIRYGRPEATRDEIETAARRAHIHDDILRLEGGLGYDTPVGDRGSRLSGGQRQRVAIARALLRDAPVLLLDEPTSALDAGSEAHVQAALLELMRGRTTIIIAHRLATVRHATCIHVLGGKDDGDRQGRIIESGTHDALMARGGTYAALALSQGLR